MKEKRRQVGLFARRFSKFSVVGLANVAVDLGTLNLLLFARPANEPWEFALYNAVALVAANVSSYVLNSLWTFKGRAEPGLRQGALFALQAVLGVGINSALFWVFIRLILNHTGLSAVVAGNTAKVAATAISSTLSYFAQRYLVFSR